MSETLTDSEVEEFIQHGYVTLHDCFERAVAEDWVKGAYERLYCKPDDPATWPMGRVRSPGSQRIEVKEFAPRAWSAIAELVGGEDRIKQPCSWVDEFLVNFGTSDPWEPPTASAPGWHKDGDFFRHFLDSGEQGLLIIALFSDLEAQGGGTFVARDSVGVVARHLAARTEGVHPGEFAFASLAAECRDFVEVTGRVGDVLLFHPFVLHTASRNVRKEPRFMINPVIKLTAPFTLRRADGRYSPVECAILRGLASDAYDFVPTAPRENIVPARLEQDKKFWEQRRREKVG